MTGAQPAKNGSQLLVGVNIVLRIVACISKLLYLVYFQAKDENIFLTNFLTNFDISTIKGADGKCAIECKFHIAGAGGFLAGS